MKCTETQRFLPAHSGPFPGVYPDSVHTNTRFDIRASVFFLRCRNCTGWVADLRAVAGSVRYLTPHCGGQGSLASPVEVQTRGILFDLDGVLVDSTPAVARCWSRWAVQYGFNAEDVVRQAHGRPSIVTLRELMPDGDYEEENRKMEKWEIADTDGVVPLPGVLEILRALPADQWAIVTSCTPDLAEVRIRVAGLPRPRKIVTSGDVKRFKPEPDPYLKGAELLGLAPTDCVVVEDAPAGIRAGRAANSRVLALRTTEADNLLNAAGATWIVNDLSKVSLGAVAAGLPLRLSLQT